MIKDLFIPTKSNNYYPLLLRKGSITVFALTLFIFNITVGSLPISKVYAAIDTSTLVELHNNERASRGLPKLVVSSKLTASAAEKAEAMLETDCWSHYCPNGKSPWDFFKDQTYDYIYAGENLAEGFSDNETVMQAWMNSPTHRDNVLKSEFREIGISMIRGDFQGNSNNIIVVVHFGTQVNSFNNLPTTNFPGQEGNVANSETSPLSAPIIDEPINGTSTNDRFFSVKGKTNEDTTVNIIDNEKLKGSVDPEGGIFTYKPPADDPYEEGNHLISSYYVDQAGGISGRSNEVKVAVDTTAPIVNTDSLEVLSTDNAVQFRFRILVQDDLEKFSLISGKQEISFVRVPDSSYWEADIPKSLIETSGIVKFTAFDKAGNIASSTLGVSSVLSAINSISSKGLASNTLKNIITREFPSIKNIISLIALILIGSLFAFDAILLSKTHIPEGHQDRGKHHLHLSNFIILLLVVFIGGAGGTIIEGLTK